ncbi:MAG TPA: MBL fold metallo-hydrolase, partial [Bacteroidetes bacterium]|nr:MBL fold metallo-hydrolase [Bacteroidota bacterium]
APFIIWHFGRLPWLSPVITLPAVLVLSLALAGGWMAVITAPLAGLSGVFAGSLHAFVWMLNLLAGWSAAHLPVATHLPVQMMWAALLAAAVLAWFAPRISRAPLPASALAVLSVACIIVWAPLWLPAGVVKLGVLDVGQGDGVLIRRGDRAVVIDGGAMESSALRRQLRMTGVKRVALWVLTHGDADHAGAAIKIAGLVPIDVALVGPGTAGDAAGAEALRALGRAGVPLYTGAAGTRAGLGSLGTLTVLSPPRGEDLERTSDNDLSLVLRWEIDGAGALFPGDASSDVEERLLQSGSAPEVDLLLAAHHGSRYSTSERWLEATSPEVAVISCGRNNPYGHPAPEVVRRLVERGVEIHRTDREGAVLFLPVNGRFVPLPWREWW